MSEPLSEPLAASSRSKPISQSSSCAVPALPINCPKAPASTGAFTQPFSVTAQDHQGRERLLRYCARAPLSLERLSLLGDGRVAYRIKTPLRSQTHRLMTPVQFLARLCALIPPPRHPLVRFHGVFASHSAWRRDVVALAEGSRSIEPPAARHRGKVERRASVGNPSAALQAPTTAAPFGRTIPEPAKGTWSRRCASTVSAN